MLSNLPKLLLSSGKTQKCIGLEDLSPRSSSPPFQWGSITHRVPVATKCLGKTAYNILKWLLLIHREGSGNKWGNEMERQVTRTSSARCLCIPYNKIPRERLLPRTHCNGCSGTALQGKVCEKLGAVQVVLTGRTALPCCSKGNNLSPADFEHGTQSNSLTFWFTVICFYFNPVSSCLSAVTIYISVSEIIKCSLKIPGVDHSTHVRKEWIFYGMWHYTLAWKNI